MTTEEEYPEHVVIDVDLLVRDEGTVVVFAGWDVEGEVQVTVDHRQAEAIVLALASTDDEAVTIVAAPWQVRRVA